MPQTADNSSEALADAMRRKGLSLRGMAVRLHQLNPDVSVESYRKAVYRWLDGAVPYDRNRELVARVLDIDPSVFDSTATAKTDRVEAELRMEIQELRDRLSRLEQEQGGNTTHPGHGESPSQPGR